MEQVIKREQGQLALPQETIERLMQYETALKALKSFYDDLKDEIKGMMTNNPDGLIKKIDNEQLSITYVPPTFKDKFDEKRFKEEHPELYIEYLKEIEVKDSLRITIKKVRQ